MTRLFPFLVSLMVASVSITAEAQRGTAKLRTAQWTAITPFETGTNIEIKIRGFGGTRAARFLDEKLPAQGESVYLKRLGTSRDGQVYYTYAGTTGVVTIGKAQMDAEGLVERLLPIAVTEHADIEAHLRRIGLKSQRPR